MPATRFIALCRNLVHRHRVDRDLDEELDAFVDLATAEGQDAGLPHHEARRRALAVVGSKEAVKERVRERRSGQVLDTIARDVSYGVRLAVRSPRFSLLVVVTLATGLAASTAMFSVVDGVLLRPLPYPDADRVVFLGPTAHDGRRHFSPPDYVEFAEFATSYEAVCAIQGDGLATLSIDGQPASVRAQEVTSGFLTVFGVTPLLGRGFDASDDAPVAFDDRAHASGAQAPGAILISHRLWQERFGSDSGVVGRLVQLDYQPYQIVGVTPPAFQVLLPDEPDYRAQSDVWVPTRMDFRTMPRDARFLRVLGRIRPGVGRAQARAEAAAFAARQRQTHPIHDEGGYDVDVHTLAASLTARHAGPIMTLLAAAGLLLLIACANLAGLLLTRSMARRREYVVRLALGSGRGRIVRQLVAEGAITAMGGILLALPLASWLTRAVVASAPATVPRLADIGPRSPVIVFTVLCALCAMALASLVPALALTRAPESESLQAAGRALISPATGGWHRLFVVAEVALTVVLLVGTALLVDSMRRLLNVEPGFRDDQVYTAGLYLAEQRYPRYPQADTRVRFVREVQDRASRLAGVEAAAVALVVPLGGQDAGHTYASEEMAAVNRGLPPAKYRPITPGYFDTVGTRLVGGRDFDWFDLEQQRLVTIVDQRLAERAWPGQDPVGRRLRIEVWSTSGGAIHLEPLWTEVVGVTENVRSGTLRVSDPETVYLPYSLYPVAELSLLVRAAPGPGIDTLVDRMRAAVTMVDPDVPVVGAGPMEAVVAASLAPERLSLGLVSAFGVFGLILTVVGIYGVVSHFVGLRLRELGLRMALGALPASVARVVLRAGFELIGLGVIVGLAASLALSRFLDSLVFGVSPADPGLYLGVAGAVLLVGLAACYAPARRASGADLATLLRVD